MSSSASAAPSKDQFDPHGHAIKAGAPAAKAAAATGLTPASACLQMHGPTGVLFKIDITFDVSTYPYKITGGSIKGTICDAPQWVVTGGHLGTTLQVDGKHTGTGSCAPTIHIVGNYKSPSSYTGTYGFFNANNWWNQTTLYCCGACT